jgi:DNA invertase Pin-like site-specific DNA recombinase
VYLYDVFTLFFSMKQYISYLRVSTKKQEKSGLGLEAQRAIVKHFSNIDKVEVVQEFIEAQSGKDIESRPILQQAIAFCKANNCILIVAKLDRLSRDVEHIFRLIRELGEGNFKSCDLPSTDSLTISIFAGLAQREKELISIRTKAALQAKKEQGVVLGKPQNLSDTGRALGVATNKTKARTNVNNIRAKSMITLCKEKSMTLQAIAKELNSNGFLTSQGKSFTETAVKRLV